MLKAIALLTLLLMSNAAYVIVCLDSKSLAANGIVAQPAGEFPVTEFALSDLRGYLSMSAGRDGPGLPPLINFQSANLGLYSSAKAQLKFDYESDLPGAAAALKDKSATGAIIDFLAVGDIANTNRILPSIDKEGVAKDQYPRVFDHNNSQLLRMLNLYGLTAEALRIGADITAANDAGKSFGRDNLPESRPYALMAYAQTLAAVHSPGASAYIAQIEPTLRQTSLNGNIEVWLGEYYESIGCPDKALALYEPILKMQENNEREAQAAVEKEGKTYIADETTVKYHQILARRIARLNAEIENKPRVHSASISASAGGLGADDMPNGQFEELSASQAKFIRIYVQLCAEISSRHRVKAQAQVDNLFALYEYIASERNSYAYQLNPFCCLTQLSRRFADGGDIKSADNILSRLARYEAKNRKYQTPTVDLYMLDVERALNASTVKKNDSASNALWAKLAAVCLNQNWREYELLRDLGCIYLQAGEYWRARVLLDHASSLCLAETRDKQPAALTQSLIYLDRSLLSLHEGQRPSSLESFNKALDLTSLLPVLAPSVRLNEYNDCFISRVVQLARILHRRGNDSLALEILQKVDAKLADNSCWLGVNSEQNVSMRTMQELYLHEYLGRLLLAHYKSVDDLVKARRYFNQAISEAGADSDVPPSLLDLRGQCAALQGDYATAADDYLRLASRSVMENTSDATAVQPALKRHYLQCAHEDALKAPSLKSETLAKIYQQLALATDDNSELQLQYYEKAYLLFSPASQDYQYVAQAIVQCATALAAATPDKPDSALIERQLHLRKRQAEQEESKGTNSACQLWVELALAEIDARRLDDARVHFEHAIDIKNVSKLDNREDYFFARGFQPFADAGRKDEAIALSKKLEEKAAQVYGRNSREYRTTLIGLFVYYANQNDLTMANDYLSQICDVDLRRIEYGVIFLPGESDGLLGACKALAEKPDKQLFALESLRKVLKSQKQKYGNFQRFESYYLMACAAIKLKLGQIDNGLADAREAVAIEALYGEGAYCGQADFNTFQLLLDRKGLDEEWLNYSKLLQMSNADKSAHSVDPPADYAALMQYRNWWQANAPYSEKYLNAQTLLLKAQLDKRNWAEVKLTARDLLQSLFYTQAHANGNGENTTGTYKKMFAFKCVIEAALEQDEREQAVKIARQALSEKTDRPDCDELVFLAEMKIVCGDVDGALAYCRQAEKVCCESDLRAKQIIGALYKQIGSKPDIERFYAQIYNSVDERADVYLQQFLDARKNGAFSRAFLKEPPVILQTVQSQSNTPTAVWTPTPNEQYRFPKYKTVGGRIVFDYAALVASKLTAGKDAKFMAWGDKDATKSYTFVGVLDASSFGQLWHAAGNLVFTYDGPKGTLIASDQPSPTSPLTFCAPPPVMALPFVDAPEAPGTANVLGKTDESLPAGDYVCDLVTASNLSAKNDDRVRLFLKSSAAKGELKLASLRPGPYDQIEAPAPVFELSDGGVGGGSRFELWYNGFGTIKIGHGAKFRGIIYAPNAVVKIGKDAEIVGAMVADRMHVGESARIMYDPALHNWKQND